MQLRSLVVALACSACITPVGPGDSDGAQGAKDAAQRDARGTDSGGSDAARRDAGNTPIDSSGGFDITGLEFPAFDIGDFDAGVAPYTGTAEDGVMCGGSACALGGNCCVGFTGAACQGDAGSCGALAFAVPCDGDEDCSGTDECCAGGSGASYSLTCVAAGSCAGKRICLTTADCAGAGTCCSAQTLITMGLEMGWCQAEGC